MFAVFTLVSVGFAGDVQVSVGAGPTFFAPALAQPVGVSAAVAVDPAFVALEGGTAALPFLVATTYGRAGASVPLRRTERATIRLQPMLGVRTVRPVGLLAVVDEEGAATFGTATTAVEAVRWLDGWGVQGRATVGFGVALDGADEALPELGLGAGLAF